MRTPPLALLLQALLCCFLLHSEPVYGAQKLHASTSSIGSRLAVLMPSLGTRSSAAGSLANSSSSSNARSAAVKFVQRLIPSAQKELVQARILPKATAHLRRLGHWAGTLWQRARVSVVSTLPDRAWLHVLTWFKHAKHRLALVLLNVAERYDLNFEYAEDWLEAANREIQHKGHQREGEQEDGHEAPYLTADRPGDEKTGRKEEHENHRHKKRLALETARAATAPSKHEQSTTSEAIEHIGYSHQGNPVVLVDIKGTWEPHTADAFNSTLCSMFEQHEEVCVLVHVSSASALASLPSATINDIVQGVLERHPGKRLNAFITPNPGRALAWAFSHSHRRIQGLQMKFVDPHDLGKLVEPNVLPESLRMVAA